jgi:hypothetical protein
MEQAGKKTEDADAGLAEEDHITERSVLRQEQVTLKKMAKNLKLWVFLVANSK